MKNLTARKRLSVLSLALAICLVPIAAAAQQTRIVVPKNKYKVQDDIRLGDQAAAEIERQFPILNDEDATAYVERVGQRLVDAIPAEFQQPQFNYRFKLVDASDINAFALPGGPMYVDRGIIQSARNEGEMAGVMAHEISHVALRHATAQATKQSSAGNTARTIGLILGGAILGGQTGAELGAVGAAAFTTKYSREYESQADMLGAGIMAIAGYDPRDLANVFQTIQQQQRGGGTPQWLSSHPDPGNRYQAINREAQYLRVSQNPIKITRDFERIQARFRGMPRARTMAEIEQGGGGRGQTRGDRSSGGGYSRSVPAPSASMREYTASGLSVSIPSNWRDLSSQEALEFAPEGAYGSQGITRGIMIGRFQGQRGGLAQDSQNYLETLLQGNTYLRQRNGFSRSYIGSRSGYMTSLSGRSPVTGSVENVTVYTTQMRNGDVLFLTTVVPDDEAYAYSAAFRNIISSLRIND